VKRIALVAVLVVALPAPASAAEIGGMRHGPVDLGDRVPYRVSGDGCEDQRVRARVRLRSGAIAGALSRPRPDAEDGGCSGVAQVPSFDEVHDAGWRAGDPLEIELRSTAGTLPLRYARIEVDRARPVAGSPDVVAAGDQDTRANDNALAMDAGDVVALGRADVRKVDSVAFRFCVAGVPNPVMPGAETVVPERAEPSVVVSLRQDGPDGAALLRVDLSHTLQNMSRFATLGFGGCYRLLPVPVTGRAMEDAPELFLRVEDAPPGAFTLNSIDLAGTGAKRPTRFPEDPPGTRTLFDGRSFGELKQTGCSLRDGAATNARTADETEYRDCALRYEKPVRNVVIRLELRRENFYDNGAVMLGDEQEIQLRSAGEFLPGGYFGHFAARWQKLTSWPEWSAMEIVQVGARHVVTVNGRTVTDVMRPEGAPEPYHLSFLTQPQWSYRSGADTGFGNEGDPDVVTPSEWGAFWFRNIRLYECASDKDPVCLRLADERRGQVPVPDGAPPEATCPRTVRFRLPAGARRVRATADGERRRARVRRRDGRTLVTVALADVERATRVVVTARAGGEALRRERTARPCA
jgi:hypothetical protein